MKLNSSYAPHMLAHDMTNENSINEVEWLLKNHGGFDPRTKTLNPLSLPEEQVVPGYLMFDSVAAALEAGVVESKNWSQQLFKDEASLQVFLDELATYDECYRIRDRWYFAFFALAKAVDEEGYVSGAELADAITDEATF